MTKVTATYLFSGYSDYWSGDGRRWDNDAGCIFACYDGSTTLHDLIDEFVDDFNAGGDCDSMSEDITGDDVREALLDMLTDSGRKDYESGALSEFAEEFASANGIEEGNEYDELMEYPVVIVLLEEVKDDE